VSLRHDKSSARDKKRAKIVGETGFGGWELGQVEVVGRESQSREPFRWSRWFSC
jgi:hypothetical protein